MSSKKPTERQLAIQLWWARFQEKHDYPPSTQECAEHFGVVPSAIQQHLLAMGQRGMVKLGPVNTFRTTVVPREIRAELIAKYGMEDKDDEPAADAAS
jgi:SOS-response transcriptional repressor LexA